MFAASVPFVVLFAVSLATALWPTGTDRLPLWQYVTIAGGTLAGAANLVAAWIHFALADGADNTISPIALQGINTLDANSWLAFNPALGVLMLGAAGCWLGERRSQSWLGWVALVLGIALFVPFADFFALILTLVWIIVASIMLFRGSPGRREPLAAPVQA